jgi:Zn-dependent protease with chaperone function
MNQAFSTTAYRDPNEHLILFLTVSLVLVVIAFTAAATFCGSVLFLFIALGMATNSTRAHHLALLERAHRVTPQSSPELAGIARECIDRLQPGPVEVYVTRSSTLNAYTFGLSDTKVVVLYSSLFELMDEDELRFILGHELGHVRLGHTRLNSLLGGMAGIPASSSVSAVLVMAFLSWNRACEHSADRAGLLACGKPEKAISALIKLVAGPQGLTQSGLEMAYRRIDAEDDTFLGGLSEALGSHPLLIKRINQIRSYAASAEYRRLQELVDRNVGDR